MLLDLIWVIMMNQHGYFTWRAQFRPNCGVIFRPADRPLYIGTKKQIRSVPLIGKGHYWIVMIMKIDFCTQKLVAIPSTVVVYIFLKRKSISIVYSGQ